MLNDYVLHMDEFLSTPSARRATSFLQNLRNIQVISIHALREEGDLLIPTCERADRLFLSTPSARRATCIACAGTGQINNFYPRPPRGGRLMPPTYQRAAHWISIHALREEGDRNRQDRSRYRIGFLSTPSARRATGAL